MSDRGIYGFKAGRPAMTDQQNSGNFTNDENIHLITTNAKHTGGVPVTDNLTAEWDAGKAPSYSGSGTTWTDLSGNGNHATLTNPSWNAGGYFVLSTSFQVSKTGVLGSNKTVIYVMQTTDTQALFDSNGNTGGSDYLAAYRSGNKGYYSNVTAGAVYRNNGTGTNIVNNLYDYIRSSNAYMISFVNTDYNWSGFGFNYYTTFQFDSGKLYAVLIYDRNLTNSEIGELYTYYNERGIV
jgi:hypothetical protein